MKRLKEPAPVDLTTVWHAHMSARRKVAASEENVEMRLIATIIMNRTSRTVDHGRSD